MNLTEIPLVVTGISRVVGTTKKQPEAALDSFKEAIKEVVSGNMAVHKSQSQLVYVDESSQALTKAVALAEEIAQDFKNPTHFVDTLGAQRSKAKDSSFGLGA